MNFMRSAHRVAEQSRLRARPPSALVEDGSIATRAAEDGGVVAVGGCNGIVLLPLEEVPDFYKAHSYVALLGLAWLGALALARLLL